jgi:hypothetical protein
MNFFEQIIAKIFPTGTPAATTYKEPFLEEKIIRGELHKQQYFRWLNEKNYQLAAKKLYQCWKFSDNAALQDWEVVKLESNGANGWALPYQEEISQEEFLFLFDFLRDRTLTLGYVLKHASRKIYNHPDRIEEIEKYYLKPPFRDLSEDEQVVLIDQQYGNITIELHRVNNEPRYLKFMATHYPDRSYTPVRPFGQLVKEILQ